MKRTLVPTIPDHAFIKSLSDILPEKEPAFTGKYIPVSSPSITSLEKKHILHALSLQSLSGNSPLIEVFEQKFAQTVSHTKYAVAVNSGTSALMIAMAILDLKPGDEVIVPSFTFIGTVNMIALFGGKPVLVDADKDTWNLDVKKLEKLITKKTRAIIPVHIYGMPCDMDAINMLAKKHNLWVIEDAAEALGTEYNGIRTGNLSDMAIFSLYANKTMTTGEGGVIVTNNKKIADLGKLLRSHAFSPEKHFWHSMLGFGVRMTSLQAAVGIAQLDRFNSLLRKRLAIADFYRQRLGKVPGITLPPNPSKHLNTHWMFGIIIDKATFGMSKNQLRKFLGKKGIETRSFFIPAHLQPIYYDQYKRADFPIAEYLCQNGLYLPTSYNLTKKQQSYIVQCIEEAHAQ